MKDVFTALASPVRRKILEELLKGETSVNKLVAQFELGRPAVSEHLQILRESKLVEAERRGREQFYRLKSERLQEVSTWMEPFNHYWRERMRKLAETLNSL